MSVQPNSALAASMPALPSGQPHLTAPLVPHSQSVLDGGLKDQELRQAALRRALAHLPERSSSDYRFRNTISYWIAVSFVEGSLLFLCGATASILVEEDWQRLGLIDYAYFAGSIFYTFGAYSGFFEVINVGQEGALRFFACSGTSLEAFWGSLLYLIGALFFNVACTHGVLPEKVKSERLSWGMYWLPSTVGSLCFTLAACVEFKHNWHASWRTPVFWLCFFYLAGSLLFLFAAAAGYPSQPLEDALVNGPYLLGSVSFALGAWCALWMWKSEQFGLGFIREINEPIDSDGDQRPIGHGGGAFASPYDASSPSTSGGMAARDAATTTNASVLPMLSEGGGGGGGGGGGHGGGGDEHHRGGAQTASGWNPARVDLKQQAFFLVYVLLGTLSVVDVCGAVAYEVTMARDQGGGSSSGNGSDDVALVAGKGASAARRHSLAIAERVLSSVSDFFGAHAILLLASVIHRTPTLHPYDYLLWAMRGIAVMFLVTETVRFAEYFTGGGQYVPFEIP